MLLHHHIALHMMTIPCRCSSVQRNTFASLSIATLLRPPRGPLLLTRSASASTSLSTSFLGAVSSPSSFGGIIDAVGHTPLIRLNTLSRETGVDVLAKAEWMNPGASVKDRAALGLLSDAERQGLLGPPEKFGGAIPTVVEGTAGNTGIGLAHLCRAKGYRCVIYMPNTQSQEKISTLRSLGADVRPVPVVPFTDENNFNHQARRFAEKLGINAVWTNQFDNIANAYAHETTTGPEIWSQLQQYYGKKFDPSRASFICSTGTGGTWAGTTTFLKAASSGKMQCVIADPPGSVVYRYVTEGVVERKGDGSITEGIGQGRITTNLQTAVKKADDAIHVPDAETIQMLFRLLDEEGIFVGASSALNAAAALKLAGTLKPGSAVVTVLSDSGDRYRSRILSKAWLESKGLYSAIPPALAERYVTLA